MPRPFTLQEIADLLRTNNFMESCAIVMLPPRDISVSDEDSGDEEGGTVYNLPNSLMRQPAYFTQFAYDGEFDSDDFLFDPRDNNFDAEIPPLNCVPKRRRLLPDRIWQKIDLTPQPILGRIIENSFEFFSHSRTPAEILELFLGDDVIDLIVQYSNGYAASKGINLDLTHSEFRCFLGIIFMSGYVPLPKRQMFWESRKDTHNALICGAMEYTRFETIFSNLHVADNEYLNPTDKFAKLRPLITKLNEKFMEFVPNETYFNFNGLIVPYYGLHGYKQHVHGKPVCFGYKFWFGATREGYVCWFQPHQGSLQEKNGVSHIFDFSDALTEAHPGQYHFVLNTLSRISLVERLSSMGHRVTGRMAKNRTERAPLESNNILRTKDVGYFDYRSDNKGNILCKWNNNNIITVASSGVGIEPFHPVNVFSEKQKKMIEVQEPNLIRVYNEYKGGVNTAFKNIEKYQAAIRGKKWYSSPLLFCFELMLQNAWQLHKQHDEQPLDMLEFRRSVANHYLEAHAQLREVKPPGGFYIKVLQEDTDDN